MKKSAALFIAIITFVLGGCTAYEVSEETSAMNTEAAGTTSFVVSIVATTAEQLTDEVTVSSSDDSTVAEDSFTVEDDSAAETTVYEEKTTKEEKNTKEENTTVDSFEDVELSISMPEKNGTMVTDSSPDNKYIKIVNKKNKIDSALLLAVYSVPESGQNYVFEFYSEEDFSSENIRRVYLIDLYGEITSVAAADGSERVNLSPVENWFCMNVLIKEIIYPAVSEG